MFNHDIILFSSYKHQPVGAIFTSLPGWKCGQKENKSSILAIAIAMRPTNAVVVSSIVKYQKQFCSREILKIKPKGYSDLGDT
jgi:hypothetical protein